MRSETVFQLFSVESLAEDIVPGHIQRLTVWVVLHQHGDRVAALSGLYCTSMRDLLSGLYCTSMEIELPHCRSTLAAMS